jgi:hypothetical protein
MVLVLSASAAGFACGDVLVDNLDQEIRGTTLLGAVAPDAIWAAQGFSGPRWVSLDSIEVYLGLASGEPDAVIELRANGPFGGPDGALVASFAVPALGSGPVQVEALVPDRFVLLRPERTYWLVMGVVSQGVFGWSYSRTNAWAGPGTIGNYTYSEDTGVTWGPQGSENPYLMRINVTPACGCDAEFNCDGFLDFFDYDAFVSCFEGGACPPGRDADFNGDGFVDFFDYDAFVGAFEAGC